MLEPSRFGARTMRHAVGLRVGGGLSHLPRRIPASALVRNGCVSIVLPEASHPPHVRRVRPLLGWTNETCVERTRRDFVAQDTDLSNKFSDLNLSAALLKNVAAEGYEIPTPVQMQAIPPILEGRDVLGSAQTGTGKTAAFALPMLHKLAETATGGRPKIRALVLAPTRELALQIQQSFNTYGQGIDLYHLVIFGGVNQNPQVRWLRQGVDIVVATPGRLMDLMEQGHVDLSSVELLVLDEADRMLDMGFIPDIRRIEAKLPKERQTLLFSATVPPSIKSLAASLLKNPVRVEIAPKQQTVDKVEQGVYFVDKNKKPALLAHLVKTHGINCGIVFSRTKHGADRVVKQLARVGIPSAAIHGNKSQNNRQRTLDAFKSGRTPILVATDVAARGIDVDGITHVINYDLTHEPETYVHRIGRTARAGASGIALSFVDRDERGFLKDIQRLLKTTLPVKEDHPDYSQEMQGEPLPEEREPMQQQKQRPPRAQQGRGVFKPKLQGAKPGRGQGGGGPKRSRGPFGGNDNAAGPQSGRGVATTPSTGKSPAAKRRAKRREAMQPA